MQQWLIFAVISLASLGTVWSCAGGPYAPVSSASSYCHLIYGSYYYTFDYGHFRSYEKCKRLLVGVCNPTPNVPSFSVYAKGTRFYPWGSPMYIEIEYECNVVRLERNTASGPVVAKVNGVVVSLPYNGIIFQLTNQWGYVVCSGIPGLEVLFNGWYTRIRLSTSYAGQTTGMCGNFYSGSTDDYRTKQGLYVGPGGGAAIGKSWRVYDQENPSWICISKPVKPVCTRSLDTSAARCDSIISTYSNKYSRCLGQTFLDSVRGDCKADVCASGGESVSLIPDYLDLVVNCTSSCDGVDQIRDDFVRA